MSDESEAPSPQLKEWFDEARHRALAQELATLSGKFREEVFLHTVLEGLEARSLMQRVHQCALAVDAALPGTFQQKVAVLRKLAPRLGHAFVSIFLCDFVATFGRAEFDFSMEALSFFTTFGSAEFAVRPFIAADQPRALKIMRQWAQHPDEHVRRLASEGSRPRLPWGMRLNALVRDPSPTIPIIEALKDDAALYVRKSVANHLNDITKDHPDLVLQLLEGWDLGRPHLRWIAKHACRTLIKRGNPRALHLFGFGRKAEVTATLQAAPARLSLGERLTLAATITSTDQEPQRLVVDYVIHYVKAGGAAFEKVFKWTEIDLQPHSAVRLAKAQVIRDFTTRRHYPGAHRVDLQINGQRVAQSQFILK